MAPCVMMKLMQVCVCESACFHTCFSSIFFLFRTNTWRQKHPTAFVSCHCPALTRSHMRKLSLLQTQHKLDSVFHTTTRNGHGWGEGYQTYNPSCSDYDFLSLKKAFHCLNDAKWKSCSLRAKPRDRILVTPSESFITGTLQLFYHISCSYFFYFLYLIKTVFKQKPTNI